MDTVDRHFHRQLHTVVEHEEGFAFLTERNDFKCSLAEFFVACVFQAKLNPFTAAFERHLHFFGYRVFV